MAYLLTFLGGAAFASVLWYMYNTYNNRASKKK